MNNEMRLDSKQFPRSSQYHPEWVIASAGGGANSLWVTEWLTTAMDLRPGMRVLDLGCGRASSSVFLHREFGLQVWATDLWFSAAENAQRIRDAGVEVADTMPDGWQVWLDWHTTICPDNRAEINALEADRGRYLGYVRIVGRRQVQAKLEDPVVSIPAQYTKKPLLRGDQHEPGGSAQGNQVT